MRYIDSYEIEFKTADGPWERVGHVYPRYRWRVVRPWLFLGLVRRPRIVNNAAVEALLARRVAIGAATAFCLAAPLTYYRVWRCERRGWRLRHRWEDCWRWRVRRFLEEEWESPEPPV
jgi:hypothetical protein